jgi:hypothetical protein
MLCSGVLPLYGLSRTPSLPLTPSLYCAKISKYDPQIAAGLYLRGFAEKVLVSQTAEVEQVAVGASPSDTELNLALLKLGVPPGAVENFGAANRRMPDPP